MIKGIGVDIIEIDRIKVSIETYGKSFIDKFFTANEIEYCSKKANPFQHFAARFAAKEAVSKALSTGWSGEFRWHDFEVTNDKLGKPYFTIYGALKLSLENCNIQLSLSHSDKTVVAFVVIEEK
ncbi:MAG: holo-ACP synthase [Bacteroidota bacterium]